VKIDPAVIFVLKRVEAHVGLLLDIDVYERRQDILPYLQRGRP
jgi:hypothetical protein